jgi:hypothetical protein
MLRFPFWLLTPKRADDAALVAKGDKWPMTFSTEAKMNAFLAHQRIDGHWEVMLVNRYSVWTAIRELEKHGYYGVCHNAEANGSGGNVMLLRDIGAASASTATENHGHTN